MSLRAICGSVVLNSLLVATFCEPAISQSVKKPTSRKVLKELVVEPVEPPRKIGQATVSYYGRTDQTLVGVSLMVVSGPGTDQMAMADLWMGFLVPGRELTRPRVVEFSLKTYGPPKGSFRRRAALEVRADDKVFRLDNVKRTNYAFQGVFDQVTSGNTSFAEFEKIVASEKIEVRAGTVKFELREADREAIKDLLKAAAGEPSARK